MSTVKQDLERQEYDLAANRREYGLNPVKKYSVKESGETILGTVEWAALEDDLKRLPVSGLNVSAVDRMARPQDLKSYGVFQVFIDHKKTIYSKREGVIEPWKPRGLRQLTAALNQAGGELSDLKDRLASNRHKMHEQQRMCNPVPYYGVLYRDKYHPDAEGKSQYYYEDPEPAAPGLSKRQVIIMIFNWRYHQHMGWTAIARKLNAMGILTAGKKGQRGPGLWGREAVIALLRNRHYIGEHWEGRIMLPLPPELQFIERRIFDGVAQMSEESKATCHGRPPTRRLLAGFLRCKFCGHRCDTQTGSKRPPAYRCANREARGARTYVCRNFWRVRCEALDSAVWRVIWRLVTDADYLLENARAYYGSLPSTGAGKLEKELSSARARMERMQEMVYLGTYPKAAGNAKIMADQKRIAEIGQELAGAGSVLMLPPAKQVEDGLREIAEGEEPGTFEERRPILEKLANLRFTYGDGEVVLEGQVPVAGHAHKCKGRVLAPHTYVQYIPFKLKERVA